MNLTSLDLSEIRRDPEGHLETLGEGLVPEVISRLKVDTTKCGGDPVKILGKTMAVFAPDKLLQNNVTMARHLLGDNVYEQCTNWLERAGAWDRTRKCWTPVAQGYWSPGEPIPTEVTSFILPPGVARRMGRDAERPFDEHHSVGTTFKYILAPRGNRKMTPETDGPDVEWYLAGFHELPTEYTLTARLYGPRIEDHGYAPKVMYAETSKGSEVYQHVFESIRSQRLLHGPVLFVSDPLSALFAAGQFLNVVQPMMGFNVEDLYVFGWDDRPLATCEAEDDPEISQSPVAAMNMAIRVLYEAFKTVRLNLDS